MTEKLTSGADPAERAWPGGDELAQVGKKLWGAATALLNVLGEFGGLLHYLLACLFLLKEFCSVIPK